MRKSIIFFVIPMIIVLMFSFFLSGCNQGGTSVNGMKEGVILEKASNGKQVKLVKFLQKDGKLIFTKAVLLDWPTNEIAIQCPNDPPNPPGSHNGCSCSGSGVNRVISCLDLAMNCNGLVSGGGVCDEEF